MAFACKFMPVCFSTNRSSREKHDSTQCSVSGDGLSLAMVGEPAKFILRTTGPDLLYLELQISRIVNNGCETSTHFPEPIPVEYECLGENIHSVCYYPKEVGEYHVAVTWKGNHVKGSPFAVKVDKKVTFPEKDDVKTEEQDNKNEVWKLRDDIRSSRRQRDNRV
nr:filamin-A-like isoform X2 [Pocillopora verrucosa]